MNLKIIKTYIISFTLTNVILVYILNLPGLITNANNLVNEYYYKNGNGLEHQCKRKFLVLSLQPYFLGLKVYSIMIINWA